MRPFLFAIGLSLASTPAWAMEESMTLHLVRGEIDGTRIDDADVVNWEGEAWIGGDRNKLWFKTEGELADGEAEHAEIRALWSRNIADFWDLQAGVRVDLAPDTTPYLALGVQGLAPYQFETEAAAFVSEDGNVSARLHQSLDLLLTQRLILEPHIEVNLHAQDVPERNIGAGISDVKGGLQLRYEITRKFAPYLDIVYERALGETESLMRDAGEEVEQTSLRIGLRFWF
jgi:copper resistance protein B